MIIVVINLERLDDEVDNYGLRSEIRFLEEFILSVASKTPVTIDWR
jgi:hypothetical protein